MWFLDIYDVFCVKFILFMEDFASPVNLNPSENLTEPFREEGEFTLQIFGLDQDLKATVMVTFYILPKIVLILIQGLVVINFVVSFINSNFPG